MTTKEKILDTALELFSRHGYDGVSVRDIARAVGIRESSLYNHFPSKRALFDGIVDFCVQQAELYFRGSGLPFDQGDDTSLYQGIPAERLHALIERTFRYFFDDPWNARFRRLLLLSQFTEPRCRDIYCRQSTGSSTGTSASRSRRSSSPPSWTGGSSGGRTPWRWRRSSTDLCSCSSTPAAALRRPGP